MSGLKVRLSIAFLMAASLSAVAQDSNVAGDGSAGCGDSKAKFEVKTSRKKAYAEPEAGSALVYFIQDDSDYNSGPKPTTRAGLDGSWVGATRDNSFFYFSVAPGLHHLCASWQPSGSNGSAGAATGMSDGQGSQEAASSFIALAGGVYYFVVKDTYVGRKESSDVLKLDLNQKGRDQGQLMANGRAVVTAKPK